MVGDGRVIQTRDVVLQVTVTLGNTHVYRVHDVLYVSQSMHNIPSVSQICIGGWTTKFTTASCQVYDRQEIHENFLRVGRQYLLNCSARLGVPANGELVQSVFWTDSSLSTNCSTKHRTSTKDGRT